MKHFTKFIAVAIMALMSINLGAVDYEKITSADQLSTGDTVVLVIQDAKTTSTLYAVKGNSTNYESVSLSSGKIVNPSAALKWKVTISGTPKTYTFSMKNGSNTYYVNNGGSNTTLSTTSSTATTWTLTAKTNNTFMIARSSATIRYLGWTGSKFGAYATTNFKDQFNLSPAANLAQYHGAISIYKKSSAGSKYTVSFKTIA